MKRLGDPNGNNKKTDSGKAWGKVQYSVIAIGILLLIVLYVREFRYFNLTLNAKPLVIGSLLVGGLAGWLIGRRLARKGEDMTERIQITIFFIVICSVFAPLFASLINRNFSFAETRTETVEFVQEVPFYSTLFGIIKGEKIRPTGYHLFFYRNGQLKRIVVKEPRFADKTRGDDIALPVNDGLFQTPFIAFSDN